MLFKKDSITPTTPVQSEVTDQKETSECACQNCKCGARAKETVESIFSNLLDRSIVIESPINKGEYIEVVRMTDVYHQLCDGHKIDGESTVYGKEWM